VSLEQQDSEARDGTPREGSSVDRKGTVAEGRAESGFGSIWLVDAILNWHPGLEATFMDTPGMTVHPTVRPTRRA
jgi:hypothetical protein